MKNEGNVGLPDAERRVALADPFRVLSVPGLSPTSIVMHLSEPRLLTSTPLISNMIC